MNVPAEVCDAELLLAGLACAQQLTRPAQLQVLLGERPFFFSDTVGVADLAIYGQLNTMRSGPTPQCEELISQRRWLLDHFKRVDEATRPQTKGATARGLKAA